MAGDFKGAFKKDLRELIVDLGLGAGPDHELEEAHRETQRRREGQLQGAACRALLGYGAHPPEELDDLPGRSGVGEGTARLWQEDFQAKVGGRAEEVQQRAVHAMSIGRPPL
mmetsp:Transcript_10961/g.25692  ORF Transcript_10961/g.25692 Transcript_10961/m.25692 type:complete len:112 (-) Transcript_10961:428-763(-)